MCPADGEPGHPQTGPCRPQGSPGAKSFPSAPPDSPPRVTGVGPAETSSTHTRHAMGTPLGPTPALRCQMLTLRPSGQCFWWGPAQSARLPLQRTFLPDVTRGGRSAVVSSALGAGGGSETGVGDRDSITTGQALPLLPGVGGDWPQPRRPWLLLAQLWVGRVRHPTPSVPRHPYSLGWLEREATATTQVPPWTGYLRCTLQGNHREPLVCIRRSTDGGGRPKAALRVPSRETPDPERGVGQKDIEQVLA